MPICAVCKKELGEKEGSVITIDSISGSCTMSSRDSRPDVVGLRESGQFLFCLAHGECFVELIKKVKDGTFVADQKKSGCFIATAAFGSSLAQQVTAFQNFRDSVLIKNSWGQWLIRFYERISPPFAKFITLHKHIRWLTRKILLCLLRFIPKKY